MEEKALGIELQHAQLSCSPRTRKRLHQLDILMGGNKRRQNEEGTGQQKDRGRNAGGGSVRTRSLERTSVLWGKGLDEMHCVIVQLHPVAVARRRHTRPTNRVSEW